MFRLRPKNKIKPFKISTLTEEQKKQVKDNPKFACGTPLILNNFVRLPQLCFDPAADDHDLRFGRGGYFLDCLEANLKFPIKMITETLTKWFPAQWEKVGDRSFRELAVLNSMFILGYGFIKINILLILYLALATIYFLAVLLFGWFSFNWGEYKTFEEVMSYKK